MEASAWVAIGLFIASIVVGTIAWFINALKKAFERLFDSIEKKVENVATDLAVALREIQVEISRNTNKIDNIDKDLAVLKREHEINHGVIRVVNNG